ncbi:hypothetical protein Hanom_Chr16g01436521 [Helianthus anomalus]
MYELDYKVVHTCNIVLSSDVPPTRCEIRNAHRDHVDQLVHLQNTKGNFQQG